MLTKTFPIHAYCPTSPPIFAKNEAVRVLDVLHPWIADHPEGNITLDWSDISVVSPSGAAVLMGNMVKRHGIGILDRIHIRHASPDAVEILENALDVVCPTA